MYSALANATIQQLLTGTKDYQNDIIRCLPEIQDSCDSGGMPPMAIGAQVTPPHGYKQTPISGALWLLRGAYGSE
jgi:hypothetical protein